MGHVANSPKIDVRLGGAPDLADVSSEWRAGWRTLFAGFIAMGVGWNFAAIVASLFLKPMQAEFGWSRAQLSFGSVGGLIVAVMLPFTGLLLDRFGPRRVAFVGITGMAFSFMAFAAIPESRPIYFTVVLCLAASGGLFNSVVIGRGVAPWFQRRLGTAVGLMMTGTSASAAVAVPALTWTITHYGWRVGFLALGVLILVIGLPILLLWFHEPERPLGADQLPQYRRHPMRAIVQTRAFWQVAIACGAAALPIGGFIGHLVPLLTDRGLTPQLAAGLGSIFAIAIGCGRIGNGILLDRLHPPAVTAGTLVLAACGAALLTLVDVSTAAWLILAAPIALIGLAQGAEGDYLKFFSMRLFGFGNFARVVSIMAMIISTGMALGGLIFAEIFDRFGSYRPAIFGSIALYAVGGLIFLSIRMVSPLAAAGDE